MSKYVNDDSPERKRFLEWLNSHPYPTTVLAEAAYEGWQAALQSRAQGEAPGMTDLMVPPESIDSWLENNPLPADTESDPRQWQALPACPASPRGPLCASPAVRARRAKYPGEQDTRSRNPGTYWTYWT